VREVADGRGKAWGVWKDWGCWMMCDGDGVMDGMMLWDLNGRRKEWVDSGRLEGSITTYMQRQYWC
jgi:hypothetical protein